MPLITTQTLPPGGWRYVQNRPDGSPFRQFVSMGPFTDFCQEILICRQSNGFPGADAVTVANDANRAQCDRLGNDPRYCGPGSGPVVANNAPAWLATAGGGCGGCGGGPA